MDNANHQIWEWYHEVDNSVGESRLIASRVQVVVLSMLFTKPKLMSHCIPSKRGKRKHNKLIFGFIVKFIYFVGQWRSMGFMQSFFFFFWFEILENAIMLLFPSLLSIYVCKICLLLEDWDGKSWCNVHVRFSLFISCGFICGLKATTQMEVFG